MTFREDFKKLGTLPLADLSKENDAKKYLIRVTSGTSGDSPLLIVRRRKEAKENRMGFYSGLRRVVGFFGSFNARVAHLSFVIFRKENSKGIFLDYCDLDSDLDKLLRQFKPDSLCGFPSFIIEALKYIKNPKTLSGIKTVRLTGEVLSRQKFKILKSRLPNASVCLFYAAAEIGFISEFCPNLPIGQYHPREGVMIDIINQDNQGVGEIVISTNLSPSVRIENYHIGDIGRFTKLENRCKCGRKVTFEVLGRKDFDFIKMCGALLTQEEFERVFLELKEYINDFRVSAEEVVVEGTILGKISLDVIPSVKLSQLEYPEDFLAEEFSKRLFVTPTQTLYDLINKNSFLPVQVNLKTELPRGYKDVKIKMIRR